MFGKHGHESQKVGFIDIQKIDLVFRPSGKHSQKVLFLADISELKGLLMIFYDFDFTKIGVLNIVFKCHLFVIKAIDSAIQNEMYCIWISVLLINDISFLDFSRHHHKDRLGDKHLVFARKKDLTAQVSKHVLRKLIKNFTCCLMLFGSYRKNSFRSFWLNKLFSALYYRQSCTFYLMLLSMLVYLQNSSMIVFL